MSKRVLLFALLTLSLALSACERKGISAPEELAALTTAEATSFAARLSQALRSCDQASLGTLIDVESMLQRTVRTSGAKAREQKGLLEGMRGNAADIRTQFCTSSEQADELEFLRVHSRKGQPSLLFRTTANQALNYLEFHAGKSKDGGIKVNNIYVYMNGQTLVETLAQMIDVLLGNESVMAAFTTLGDKITSNPQAALLDLAALPKAVREAKPLQLLKIQAASAVDDATYEAAISEYEALFPDDPSLNLVSLDGFIVRKNYQAALQAVDKLDAVLGGDPHLDTVRVGLLLEEGNDLGRATELAEKRVQDQPEDENAHYDLLGVHVANRNFGGAVAIMRLMGERFELVFEDKGLDPSNPDYAALKASPEWQAYVSKTEP